MCYDGLAIKNFQLPHLTQSLLGLSIHHPDPYHDRLGTRVSCKRVNLVGHSSTWEHCPLQCHIGFFECSKEISFSDLRMMLVFRPPGPKCCPEMARILFSTVSTATDVCRAVFTAQRCKQVSFDCESCDPSSWLSPQANTVPLLERANVEFLESHWNQIGSSKQRCLQRSSGLYRCFQAF